MPFNWKTPIGYAISMLVQCGAWFYLLISGCCILSFSGGACWLLIAIIEDIGQEFHNINKMRNNNPVTALNAHLKMKFHKIIQFHSTAKE